MMFGLGGIHVEILKDVSFGITPLNDEDAKEMVRFIKGYSLLKGVRGEEAVDEEVLTDALQRLSRLVTDFHDIAELDVNPFVVGAKSGKPAAIDARILLTDK